MAVVRTDPWTWAKGGRSGIDKRPVDGPVRLTESGVDGDTICDVAHHGGPDQAVYAYSTDDLAWWSAELRQAGRDRRAEPDALACRLLGRGPR